MQGGVFWLLFYIVFFLGVQIPPQKNPTNAPDIETFILYRDNCIHHNQILQIERNKTVCE